MSKASSKQGVRPQVQSMTGFGRAIKTARDVTITVDVRSTNHRYLEIDIRLPGGFSALQGQLSQKVREALKRGRIELFCNIQSNRGQAKQIVVNEELAQSYYDVLQELRARFGITAPIGLDHLLQFPQIISTSEERLPSEILSEPILRAADLALKALIAAKRREGRQLSADILRQLRTLQQHEHAIKRRLPKALKEQRDQLRERIGILLKPRGGVSVTQLEEALALMKDADVNEELVRIESHIGHMRQTLQEQGLVGKQIDFIAQELTRETNTLGAKVSDPEAARRVVEMKGCIEKIREQTQNLE